MAEHVAAVAMAVAMVAMAVDGEVEVEETVVVVMEAVKMEAVAMEVEVVMVMEAVAVVMEVEVVALKMEVVETVAMEEEARGREPKGDEGESPSHLSAPRICEPLASVRAWCICRPHGLACQSNQVEWKHDEGGRRNPLRM